MEDLPLPRLLERRDPERLQRYREYLAFSQGDQWPSPARRRERRLTFTYARVLIDKVTSCLLSGLTITAEPWDPPEARERARRAGEALLEVAEANALEQLDSETAIDTAIRGDGAYKVTWDPEEGRVRVTAPDVQGLFA